MIRHILRVYKLPYGTSRQESRKAIVEFYDDNIMYEADIPEYPRGTVVDVVNGQMSVVEAADGSSDALRELRERERFYQLTKEILCYKDFELLFCNYSSGSLNSDSISDLFIKNPFSIFDEAYFSHDVVMALSITPSVLCAYTYPTTFQARKQEIYAFIDYALQEAEKNGNTGLPYSEVLEKVREMFRQASQPLLEMESDLIPFLNAKDIWGKPTKFCVVPTKNSEPMVYRKNTYNVERFVYESVKERANRHSNLACSINSFQNPLLSEEQKNAVRFVFDSPGNICIIHGGPGTGKTTIIDEIVCQGRRVLSSTALIRIATPTGKAAKRAASSLSESAKADSSVSTIHKFVGFGMGQSDEMRMDLEGVLEDTFLIVVDEASMMDLRIFEQLLDLANPYAKIVLVGDADQLPSVDIGDVLQDLIMLNIPEYSLHENYRSGNVVVETARKINEGVTELGITEVSSLQSATDSGVYLVDISGMDDEAIVSLVSKTAVEDIYKDENNRSGIIITPRRVGVVSSQSINEKIEEYMQDSYEDKGIDPPYVFDYLVGDPVIINETNYHSDTPYMNGETGILLGESSSEDGSVIYLVDIDGNEVFVEGEKALSLSYAITIHKSQGSEYPTVYIVAKESDDFFTRRMLYTAITRAKSKVCLFANEQVLKNVIKNKSLERHTYMKTAEPIFPEPFNYSNYVKKEERLCG